MLWISQLLLLGVINCLIKCNCLVNCTDILNVVSCDLMLLSTAMCAGCILLQCWEETKIYALVDFGACVI
jgi:hypothetical protein